MVGGYDSEEIEMCGKRREEGGDNEELKTNHSCDFKFRAIR